MVPEGAAPLGEAESRRSLDVVNPGDDECTLRVVDSYREVVVTVIGLCLVTGGLIDRRWSCSMIGGENDLDVLFLVNESVTSRGEVRWASESEKRFVVSSCSLLKK